MAIHNRLIGTPALGGLAAKPMLGPPLPRGLLSETLEDAEQRRAEVRSLIRQLFKVAVGHLGEKEAKSVWADASKGQRGRKPGTSNIERDDLIFTIYDDILRTLNREQQKSLPRFLAKYTKEKHPDMFPATEAFIETHIRRLLKQRAAKERATRAIYAKLLSQGAAPLGLLGNLSAPSTTVSSSSDPGGTKKPGI